MNEMERRLLHGLYFERELVACELLYNAPELRWLLDTPIPNGRNWRGTDKRLKSCPVSTSDPIGSFATVLTDVLRPLAYLAAAGYVSYTHESDIFRVQLTALGADIARKLDSRMGRCELWYSDHKDGLAGLVITIATSAMTAILTVSLGF
jgi:hypothetical protein